MPRAVVAPPSNLTDRIFPTASQWLEQVEARKPSDMDLAAQGFLRLLIKLRVILLQDAAVLIDEYPQLVTWRHKLFTTSEFHQCKLQVREAISVEKAVTIQLEAAMLQMAQSVQSGFTSLNVRVNTLRDFLKQQFTDVKTELSRLQRKQVVVHVSTSDEIEVAQESSTIGATGHRNVTLTLRHETTRESMTPDYKLQRGLLTVEAVWDEYNAGWPDNCLFVSLTLVGGTRGEKMRLSNASIGAAVNYGKPFSPTPVEHRYLKWTQQRRWTVIAWRRE